MRDGIAVPRFPRFPWYQAAEDFMRAYHRGVAWSTVAEAFYVRTWYVEPDKVAWVQNVDFVWDLLPEEMLHHGVADEDFGRTVHALRMLVERDGDPATWEADVGVDTWRREDRDQ